MSEAAAETLIMALGLYFLVGALVGLVYMFGGAGRIDPAAKGQGIADPRQAADLPGHWSVSGHSC